MKNLNFNSKRKTFKQSILYVLACLLCAAFIARFYFDQESTEKSSVTPKDLPAPSTGCTATEMKDSELLAMDRHVGSKMDEDEAMAFLFKNYDRNAKIAEWCPVRDSDVFQYLYQEDRPSKLQTAPAFTARYEESGKPHFIIIIQTAHYFDSCHSCTVVLGGAIFFQVDGQWHLKALNRAIEAAGSWGKAPNTMTLVKIGPDLHAVAVKDGYMAQGEYSENYFILAPVDDGVEQVFYLFNSSDRYEGHGDTTGSNSGYSLKGWAYDSCITFLKGTHHKFYDIEVLTKGTKDNNQDTVAPFKETSYYHFSGCGYMKGPAIDFSEGKPFYVQVGAFEKYPSASNLVKKLRAAGYPSYCAFFKPAKGNSFFRIRIGNFSSEQEAKSTLFKIRQSGYDGFVAQK